MNKHSFTTDTPVTHPVIHIKWRLLNTPPNASYGTTLDIINTACKEWNRALRQHIHLSPGVGGYQLDFEFRPNVVSTYDKTLQTVKHIVYQDIRTRHIAFDTANTKWAIKGWRSLFRVGEDMHSATLHHIGVALGLPDTPDKSTWIMCPTYGRIRQLTTEEIVEYNRYFSKVYSKEAAFYKKYTSQH